MLGADQTDNSLLRSCSFRAEKLLKARGHFSTVLWVALYPDGKRRWWDTPCVNAPDATTDAELLTGLASDMGLDFAELGVVRFAVAYLATRVTVIRPVNKGSTMQETKTKRQGVVIELHGVDQPVRIFREIIPLPGRAPILGAPTDQPFIDSPYAGVMPLATKWRSKPRQEAKVSA